MLDFKILLDLVNIDPAEVLLVRHPRPRPLWSERPRAGDDYSTATDSAKIDRIHRLNFGRPVEKKNPAQAFRNEQASHSDA